MNKILTIDQGTTSSRSIIFDQNGDIQDLAQQEYPLIYPDDGWVEIEPHVLMDSVEQTLNNINLDEIAGIGMLRKRELLSKFGTAKAISKASKNDLKSVSGISESLAKIIYDHFRETS